MLKLKKGNIIYRVLRVDDQWYYCIYEVQGYYYHGDNTAKLLIAPILTWYDARYSSVSTLTLKGISEDWTGIWVHSWDYITTDEFDAKRIYSEKQNA